MHLNKFLYLVLIFSSSLLTVVANAGQNNPLEIIDLNNRPAEEMIPIIKPMLKPNDAITGTGY